jgi:hypothetical protein
MRRFLWTLAVVVLVSAANEPAASAQTSSEGRQAVEERAATLTAASLTRFGQTVDDASIEVAPSTENPSRSYLVPAGGAISAADMPATLEGGETGNYVLQVYEPGKTGDKFVQRIDRFLLSEEGEIIDHVESSATVTRLPVQRASQTGLYALAQPQEQCYIGAQKPYHEVSPYVGNILTAATYLHCNVGGMASQTSVLWELWYGQWSQDYDYAPLEPTPYGFLRGNSTWNLANNSYVIHTYGTTCWMCSVITPTGVHGPTTVDSPLLDTWWQVHL